MDTRPYRRLSWQTWLGLFLVGGPLCWCEIGGLLFFGFIGSRYPAYPSGWPFCHLVYLRQTNTWDVNVAAGLLNVVTAIILLSATAYVLERCIVPALRIRQFRLATLIGITAVIASLLAIARRHQDLFDYEYWIRLGLVPMLDSSPELLPNHWHRWLFYVPILVRFGLRDLRIRAARDLAESGCWSPMSFAQGKGISPIN